MEVENVFFFPKYCSCDMNHNLCISNEWICVNRLQDAPVLVAQAPKTVQALLNMSLGQQCAWNSADWVFNIFIFFYVVYKDIS